MSAAMNAEVIKARAARRLTEMAKTIGAMQSWVLRGDTGYVRQLSGVLREDHGRLLGLLNDYDIEAARCDEHSKAMKAANWRAAIEPGEAAEGE